MISRARLILISTTIAFLALVPLTALAQRSLSAPTGAQPAAPQQVTQQVTSVAFDPSGTMLAAGGYRVVTIFDAGTGRELARLTGHAGAVTSVQYSSDGRWLAAAGGLPGRSGEVKLWDVSGFGGVKNRQIRPAKTTSITLQGPSDVVCSVAFSPDGGQLAAASYDHDVTLWNLGAPSDPSLARGGRGGAQHSALSAQRSRILKDHTDAVYAVAFSPDGKYIASGAGDRTVKVWSAATGKRLYTLSESTAEVYSVAFRPGGKQIAAGGADKQIRTWNITPTSGAFAKSAFAHNGAILRVAYSRDGQALVTSGEDDAVKRWDPASLVEQRVYPKLPDWPQGIALSPNGKVLAVGCHNGLIALFDAETGRLLREPVKGTPVAKTAEPAAVPRVSTIPGRRIGDSKQRGSVNKGGVTLQAASLGDIAPKGAPPNSVSGTVRLTLFGSLISDAMGVYFDDPAMTGKIVMPPDSNPGILRVDAALGAGARIGIHRVFVQTPRGTTGSITFAVGAWPEIGQVEPNNTSETAQAIKTPSTVVGALDVPGDVDCYRVEAKAGQEMVFEVVAQPLRSRLQPILTLFDSEGKPLAESQTRIGRPDTLLGYQFVKDGSYVVQLRDFESAGGADVHYRLNVGEFPVVTDVFPLGARAGSTAEVQVIGFNLDGAKTAKVNVPNEVRWGKVVGVSLNTSKGPLYLSRPLQIGEDPEILQSAGNDSLMKAQRVTLPVAINGRLSESDTHPSSLIPHPSLSHYYRFTAKKGQPLTIEVGARRFGSPLDSEIEVLDVRGKPIERAVVRPVYQTEVTLNDRDSATNTLRIFAWDGVGIGDYMMVGREVVKVVEMPRGPDSDIFFRTYRGQRTTYFGTTPEYHSVGQPVYKVEIHPPGTSFSPNGYPLTRVTYRNDDGGVLYGKDSHLDFIAPEDGEYIVRIGDTRGQQGPDYAYRLLIHPPRPDYKLILSPENPNLPKGGATVVNVECERYDGFENAVDVRMEGLPKGFSATSTTIEAGETSASILIQAAPDAITPSQPESGSIRIVGRARIGGQEVVRAVEPDNGARVLTLMPAPDVRVATDRQEVTIHPGEEIMLEVRANRQGSYGGRIPIEVRNLPFGVQVQNIGLNGILVTEEDTSRKVAIRCEPWVKPQTRQFYMVANVEGGFPSAGAPITLKVEPLYGGHSATRSARARR